MRDYEIYTTVQNESLNIRGDRGEDEFRDKLVEMLSDDQFKVLNNIYIPSTNEKYLGQIDSLLIGKRNIYVIEIKKWKGKIEGDLSDLEWIVENNKDPKRKSPYYQNKYHVKEVRKLVSYLLPKESQIMNAIINMERDAVFNIRNSDRELIFDDVEQLLELIKEIENKEASIITPEVNDKIINKILQRHFELLEEMEFKINKKLLAKHNLEYISGN
ncbi:NERD domain-containing protein [Natroniella acetigena]|uniref:nuclease-related domain-containing protein n=1 Tax=Natroniella acetigena TaxID=52004 RepID=UPI00200AA815|nr:nuclease-related domain-containing protein [Natroniella acetigena]MCK8827747.1 NERD domain-containing protein [Natroniella acetigena]